MTATSSLPGPIATQILFFVRFVQQCSIVLTSFIAIYFVYWHDKLRDPVPLQLVVLIVACALTLLESYIFTALSLSQRDATPKYRLLLKTSTPCSLALGIGYYTLRQTPFLGESHGSDNWFRPIRVSEGYTLEPAGVEQHHLALACTIIAAGAVALTFTLFVSAFAVVCIAMESRTCVQGGYVMLGEEFDGDDDTICSHEEFVKI